MLIDGTCEEIATGRTIRRLRGLDNGGVSLKSDDCEVVGILNREALAIDGTITFSDEIAN